MSRERLFALSNKWFVASASLTLGFALLVAIGGFVVLPFMQSDLRVRNVWDAICSAAGVPRGPSSEVSVGSPFKTSDVVTPVGLGQPDPASIGRGATLALRCAICHDAGGIDKANVPSLAGQRAELIGKELQDFRSGARENVVMGPLVATLSEHDILDLAAYYSQLPRRAARQSASFETAPAIVARGVPMRNIPPCASCHDGSGGPLLMQQPAVYLKAQLEAFKTGVRHNDISQRMRNVARGMTSAEIDASVRYYQSGP